MAALHPFRALRPIPDAAPRIAAVPYDVVSVEEARAAADGNALSFLRVSRAEIELPPGTDPYSDPVYQRAARNFTALRGASLVLEDEPSLYLYRLLRGAHAQTGIAACFSIDEYETDLIKKHERTRPDKEDDRTRHMLALGAQTGPVFLTYRAAPSLSEIKGITRDASGQPPLFDFDAADGVRHTLWRVGGRNRDELVAAFGRVPALYIADGHHRAASAARAWHELRGRTPNQSSPGDASTMLAVAFPHDEVLILPYNRIVRDLGGMTAEAVMQAIRARFDVTEGPASPVRRGHIGMFLGGAWQTLRPKEGPQGASGDSLGRLDVTILQDRLLAPVLGIGDVRTDKRIDFVGGGRGTQELEQMVRSGRAAVAFSLYPVSIEDLMAASDAGEIMPPKSSWFEPKLRDGLLVHLI